MRERLGIGAEGAQLVRKAHDPAVRMRAADRNVEHLPRQHVARGCAAADHRRARAVDARVRPLRAAQAELQHRAALRRAAHAAGLGGDERLVVDEGEDRRLDQLRLHDRRAHAHERLVREHDRALAHGVDLAGEAQLAKIGEERLVEQAERAQIGQILLGKVQAVDVVDHALQPGGDGIGDVALGAEEHVEHALVARHAVLEIAVHHGELVQIGHHG